MDERIRLARAIDPAASATAETAWDELLAKWEELAGAFTLGIGVLAAETARACASIHEWNATRAAPKPLGYTAPELRRQQAANLRRSVEPGGRGKHWLR